VAPAGHGQGVTKQPVPTSLPRESGSYREIVKQALPAVVSIESKTKPAATKQSRKKAPVDDPRVPPELKKFFEDFDTPDAPQTPQTGFGSGFFIDASGIVLTNAHVVEGADIVTVTTNDGRKFTGHGVKFDSKTDLAIVRVDGKGTTFPYLELDDSDAYEIGDRVLAIGAPFGLTSSVTSGIVSAKGRSDLHMNMYEDFIQTDAAINPGNSGGPLIGLNGKVVGINAAIKSRSGGFQGVGLAVASNLAKNVVHSLQTDGIVHRGYLGVKIGALSPEVAERMKVEKGQGVVIGEVYDNTPAQKAGLQAGDIITSVGGRPVKDGRSLQWLVANLPIKKATNLEVLRDGKKVDVAVTIEEQPQTFGRADNQPAPRQSPGTREQTKLDKLGLEVADLTKEQADELGYRKDVSGVVIMAVTPDSPADSAGLRKGMVISKIDSRKVASIGDVRQAMENASMQRGVLLMVQSPSGGTNFVLLRSEG
jgi:serine protease Do